MEINFSKYHYIDIFYIFYAFYYHMCSVLNSACSERVNNINFRLLHHIYFTYHSFMVLLVFLENIN